MRRWCRPLFKGGSLARLDNLRREMNKKTDCNRTPAHNASDPRRRNAEDKCYGAIRSGRRLHGTGTGDFQAGVTESGNCRRGIANRICPRLQSCEILQNLECRLYHTRKLQHLCTFVLISEVGARGKLASSIRPLKSLFMGDNHLVFGCWKEMMRSAQRGSFIIFKKRDLKTWNSEPRFAEVA